MPDVIPSPTPRAHYHAALVRGSCRDVKAAAAAQEDLEGKVRTMEDDALRRKRCAAWGIG